MNDPTWPRRTRLGDHRTWRPEWTVERPLLWWYLTFDHLPAVVDHATRAAAALEPLEHVDVPPREWLHLTLCEVGYRDEVDEGRLEEAIHGVRRALRDAPPVDFRLGPVNTLQDAIVLEAHPWDTLRLLRATVRGAMASAGIDPPQQGERDFWPHVTIGYLNRCTDHRPLMEAVGATAHSATRARTDRLELVEVTRVDRHYRWLTRASLALGRAPAHSR